MLLPDTTARVNNALRGMGLPPVSPEIVESKLPDARRSVGEQYGLVFRKEVTLAMVNGIAPIYNKTTPLNIDLLWKEYYGPGLHSDGTSVSILGVDNPVSDIKSLRAMSGYYQAIIRSGLAGLKAELIAYQWDGISLAPDGTVVMEFVAVASLEDWAPQYESQLVERLAQMLRK